MNNDIISTNYIVVPIHIVAGRRSVVREQRENRNSNNI